MEVEITPISMDARIEYLQNIAENQQVNTKKFSWGAIVISFILGAGVACVAIYYQKYRKEKRKAMS